MSAELTSRSRDSACAQQPPADRISNVLNGGNDGGNGGGRTGGSRNFDQGSRASTGNQGGRSAADIAATSPQSNVFRSGVKTAATNPRELRCRRHSLHSLGTHPARITRPAFDIRGTALW